MCTLVVINIFKRYGQECIMALTHYSHLTKLSMPTKNHYEKVRFFGENKDNIFIDAIFLLNFLRLIITILEVG